jgi:glyoxylase-like metal-dependent hydrolase (beta-lactamase superfamily II)
MQRRGLLAVIGSSLLVGPLRAQGTDATPAGFAGRVFVNEAAGVRLHTYIAAPQGALVTSHVIETSAGLVLVDGQFAPGSAQELRRYTDSLGQPVAQAWLSHQHPDHWFGFHHLGRPPVQAGPTTVAFLRSNGAALVAERRADSSTPDIAGQLAEGERVVGGVTFRLRRVLDTEAPEIMVIEVPAARAVIVQDLVYNRVHAVVSRQIDNWVSVLRGLQQDGARTPLILAGHGEPAAVGDLAGMIRYLETVKPLMAPGASAEAIVAEMTRAFPDHRLPPLLQLGLSRALPG